MNFETLKMELNMMAMDEFTAGTNSTSLDTSEGTSEGTSDASTTSTLVIETETITD